MGKPKSTSGIRLDADLVTAMDEMARDLRTTRSAVARMLLDEALRARRAPHGEMVREVPAAWGERPRLAPSADEAREPHTTDFPVVALAAAGSGRGAELLDTGETVNVPNTLARIAARRKWEFVRVVGDSMEPTFFEGDILAIEPSADISRVKSGDVCYFRFNGDPQIKELRITDKGRRVTLLPRNTRHHEPMPLLESDTLELVGIVRDLAHRADAARKG